MELLIDLPNIQIQDACEDRSGNYILTLISVKPRVIMYRDEVIRYS